jgi:hypothetical protein
MAQLRKGALRQSVLGQGTVEFALAMTLTVGFVLFFFQLSLVFAFGNYAHYATFMAARALLSAGESPGDQATRAQHVISLMLKKSASTPGVERLPTIAKSQGGGAGVPGMDINLSNFDSDPTNYSWAQGVRYTYISRVFLMPLGLGATLSDQNNVTFKSESWLGREATDQDCISNINQYSPNGKGIYDNGC